MSSTAPAFSILAAIDFSDTSSLVVQEAVELARRKHAAQLHFLHVNATPMDDAERDAQQAELLEWLGVRLKGSAAVPQGVSVVGHLQSGDPAKLILEMAGDLSADMVVVGTHGRKGIQRLLLGSVAAAVVKDCGCPVLVVRAKVHDHPSLRVEPPCARCVETRIQSHGQTFWCEQHQEKHGRRHTYYNQHAASWSSHRMMP
jgi:nucleotide-binding universal stress UspA family protein